LKLANRYMMERDKVDIYVAVGSVCTNTKVKASTEILHKIVA